MAMDWEGFERCRFELARPLLVVKGSQGVLSCGYLSVDTANQLGETLAVVRGVSQFDDMLAAKVVAVSDAAQRLGLEAGMSGQEVLERIR
jgi:uncharacterized protein YunC (DUF1805 family)